MRRIALAVSLSMLCVTSVSAQSPEQKKATVKFLQDLQVADGGFVPAPVDGRLDTNPKGSLRATSSALRALKYFGGAPIDKAGAEKFVRSCFDATSSAFSDHAGGKPDVFTTAVGIMAAVEVNLPAKDYVKATEYICAHAKDFEEIRIAAAGLETMQATLGEKLFIPIGWTARIEKMKNADGSYGNGAEKARATGGTVVLLLRLGNTVAEPAKVLAILNAGQNKDGGFGRDDTGASDLESGYRILRCYHMLKAKPRKVDALKQFIATCRNPDGGYGVQPAKPSSVGGTYFAGIILHWLGEQ